MRAVALEVALVVFLMDHRVALFALVTLIVAAAIPLAFAWARVLPEEPPPFQIEPGSFPSVDLEPPQEVSTRPERSALAIALLVCVTIGYVLQVPGVPRDAAVRWLNTILSGSTALWVTFGTEAALVVTASFAAGYAILRPGPLRTPLGMAAALVLILWLIGPLLRLAMLAG
jgi:hypothetical protein